MTGTNGRVTNYADIDELMNQYGRSLPDGYNSIQDLIRRENNATKPVEQHSTADTR